MKTVNFNSIDRVLSYSKFQNYKELTLPEVCFAGRSNVGKSSLINAILNRKGIAKTSKRPGQTNTILFYRVDKIFSLVDVPGYGYASVSKKKITEISSLLYNYFKFSKNLKNVYVLIDSRHGIKKSDLQFLSFLKENKLNYNYIFTKSDKATQKIRKEYVDNLCKEELAIASQIIFISSKTKEGIKKLKGNILKVVSDYGKNP